jgi:hypothetical protein
MLGPVRREEQQLRPVSDPKRRFVEENFSQDPSKPGASRLLGEKTGNPLRGEEPGRFSDLGCLSRTFYSLKGDEITHARPPGGGGPPVLLAVFPGNDGFDRADLGASPAVGALFRIDHVLIHSLADGLHGAFQFAEPHAMHAS